MSEANRLLDPALMPLEMGYERLADGVLHVAVRTDLHGCTGEMFEWWFRFRPDTQKYIWWHPVDHISSEWIEGTTDTHVGSIHVVEESFSGQPAENLTIQFRNSAEFFDKRKYDRARQSGDITASVCGHVGFSHEPERDEDGKVLGGRLLHMGRDTSWGCALRSHFFLGQDLPTLGMSSEEIKEMLPDQFGPSLLKHCYDEITFLSKILPGLFIAENRDTHAVKLPW